MNLNLPSFGDYKMLKKIGSGGMASIFLAKKKTNQPRPNGALLLAENANG